MLRGGGGLMGGNISGKDLSVPIKKPKGEIGSLFLPSDIGMKKKQDA